MKYAIIGSGPAGIFATEAVRRLDGTSSITLVTEESAVAHSPVMLTYWIGGDIPRQSLFFRDPSWAEKMRIDLRPGRRALSLQTQNRKLILDSGEEIPYDRIVIATGSSPLSLPVSGGNLRGVYAIRRIADAETLWDHISTVKEGLIIGGGFIGLKLAGHLKQRGISVTLLEKETGLAPRMLDQRASQFLIDLLRKQAIRVEMGVEVEEVLSENGWAAGLRLRDGRILLSRLIIQCLGVRPNVRFLSGSGLEVDEGIPVNSAMETNRAGVYAAGDVTLTIDWITEERFNNATWPAASRQGIVAGTNMAGGKISYQHNFPMNALHLFGVPVLAAGNCGEGTRGEPLVEKGKQYYRKLLFREGRLIGFILIGEVSGAGFLLASMKKKEPLSPEDIFDKSCFYRKFMPYGFGYRHGSLFLRARD